MRSNGRTIYFQLTISSEDDLIKFLTAACRSYVGMGGLNVGIVTDTNSSPPQGSPSNLLKRKYQDEDTTSSLLQDQEEKFQWSQEETLQWMHPTYFKKYFKEFAKNLKPPDNKMSKEGKKVKKGQLVRRFNWIWKKSQPDDEKTFKVIILDLKLHGWFDKWIGSIERRINKDEIEKLETDFYKLCSANECVPDETSYWKELWNNLKEKSFVRFGEIWDLLKELRKLNLKNGDVFRKLIYDNLRSIRKLCLADLDADPTQNKKKHWLTDLDPMRNINTKCLRNAVYDFLLVSLIKNDPSKGFDYWKTTFEKYGSGCVTEEFRKLQRDMCILDLLLSHPGWRYFDKRWGQPHLNKLYGAVIEDEKLNDRDKRLFQRKSPPVQDSINVINSNGEDDTSNSQQEPSGSTEVLTSSDNATKKEPALTKWVRILLEDREKSN